MTKRPKWLDRPAKNMPAYLRDYKSEGRGISEAMHDIAFWLGDDTSEIDPWVSALEAIDKRRDKEPLIALLKSDRELSHEARAYLADLLDRYQLKKKRGGQSTAAYDRSPADRVLELGDARANDYIERDGMTVERACNKAEKEFGIPDGFLIDFHTGKRGGSARIKKRRT